MISQLIWELILIQYATYGNMMRKPETSCAVEINRFHVCNCSVPLLTTKK